MKLSIQQAANDQTILSGAAPGRKLLATLIDATPSSNAPEVLFLDFQGVEVATASFLRESVIGFRDFARASLQNIYPVVANAEPAVLEELELFVNSRGDALWCCSLDAQGRVSNPYVMGDLDPVQQATFQTVVESGTVTAPELAARTPDNKVGPTAWNNRLSTLAAKGLLLERRQGKTKVFSPLLGGS